MANKPLIDDKVFDQIMEVRDSGRCNMGFTIVEFGQGYKDMSPASKEFFKLMMERKIIHSGNPVLRWMAGNVVIETDPAGNIKPTKAKSPEKIDGIVAAIMALDRCVRHQEEDNVYNHRGMIFL